MTGFSFAAAERLIYGTYPLVGKELRGALELALESGYRHIDTAQWYANEDAIGETLCAAGEQGGEIFVTTKVKPDNFAAKDFMPSVRRSLELLRRDRVDMLLLHWPPLDGSSIKPSLELLIEARREGLARHIGVSNYTAAMLREASEFSSEPIACNQLEFHPLLDQSKLLKAAADCGIALSGYCATARGEVQKHGLLAQIGAAHGKSAVQVALRWILQKGVAPIAKSANPDNIRANFDCLDFDLGDNEVRQIDELNSINHRIVRHETSPGVSLWN